MYYRPNLPDKLEEELMALHKAYLDTLEDDIIPDDYMDKYDEYVFKHLSPEYVKAYKKYLKAIEHDDELNNI